MTENPFASLVVARRTAKPRESGLTMMADWGLSCGEQQEFLTVGGPYVDLAKIVVGLAALFTSDTLTQKIALYAAHDILTFPGGQFLEYSVAHNRTDEYLQACVTAGFPCIEVSDNLLQMDLDAKCDLIRKAREAYGLRVLGEVGKKEGIGAQHDLAEDAARCLRAGAEKVFLEAADFFTGDFEEEKAEKIVARCGLENLLFELPGPWIEGITSSDVHRTTRWLLQRFGAEVNIANVMPANVLSLEALRLGIGVAAGW